MRTAGIMVTSCVLAFTLNFTSGCKAKGDANASPDPAALKAQQDLIARRDTLMAQRQALEGERTKIETEIQKVQAAGGDATELTQKKAALDTQIAGQSSDLTSLTTKLDEVVARGDAAALIASREANMGGREKSVAQREKEIADRERTIASREAALAQREKETCGAAAPMIIQQVAPKSGGSYGKSDVQPLLAKAKAITQKKGILPSDLPGGAQNLESQATDAIAAQDWSKAYFAAAQLVATLEQIKIDRLFIQAKMARLNRQLASSKVDEATNQQLVGILSDVAQKYNDGNFSAVNQRLNQLASQLK
ncbi:MAG: hypothetical protein H0T89_34645 [Deltaproteobacteria bacterium]|nr:hypothetical protein [Deltaproteobacteria bacterium]